MVLKIASQQVSWVKVMRIHSRGQARSFDRKSAWADRRQQTAAACEKVHKPLSARRTSLSHAEFFSLQAVWILKPSDARSQEPGPFCVSADYKIGL